MSYTLRRFSGFLALIMVSFASACGGDDDISSSFTFTAVGSSFGTVELIDLEFLPGQGGEAIVITKGGTVFYMTSDFAPLAQTQTIECESEGEQGLLNVAADPSYDTNGFVYFYYTAVGGGQNQVERFTVSVDVDAGTFSLSDQQRIIEFSKSDASAPNTGHDGGGMVFDDEGRLLIGVGDGSGESSTDIEEGISQNVSNRLGKIFRVIPERNEGVGGFGIPDEGNIDSDEALPEIYSYGVRNPFTLVYGNDALFIGDVGGDGYEELNMADDGGLNFGWPDSEGPTNDPDFESPIHGYDHDDPTFINDDPEEHEEDSEEETLVKFHDGIDHGDTNKSIMVTAFYTGDQYEGKLTNRLIYNDYFLGWVRGLKLDENNNIVDDDHLTHFEAMTSLQLGPDGFLYAVSLYLSDQIFRLELATP